MMDTKEDILDALEEFSLKRKHDDEIPLVLEKYLCRIAATGEPMFPWTKLKPLFLHKLNQVVTIFQEKNDDVENTPPLPNVENVKIPDMKDRLNRAVNSFDGIPFTIQRLCELVTKPLDHYKRTDKFMRGFEKNIMVVTTIDPFGNRMLQDPGTVLNGLEANGCSSSSSSADVSREKLNVSLATPPHSPSPAEQVGARGDAGELECGGEALHSTGGGRGGGEPTEAAAADDAEMRVGGQVAADVATDTDDVVTGSADGVATTCPHPSVPLRRNSSGFEPSVGMRDESYVPCDKEHADSSNESADSTSVDVSAVVDRCSESADTTTAEPATSRPQQPPRCETADSSGATTPPVRELTAAADSSESEPATLVSSTEGSAGSRVTEGVRPEEGAVSSAAGVTHTDSSVHSEASADEGSSAEAAETTAGGQDREPGTSRDDGRTDAVEGGGEREVEEGGEREAAADTDTVSGGQASSDAAGETAPPPQSSQTTPDDASLQVTTSADVPMETN